MNAICAEEAYRRGLFTSFEIGISCVCVIFELAVVSVYCF